MSCWASSVEPPMCGVRMTLGRPRSSEANSSPRPFGSCGNTSMAAPAMCPDSMLRRRAAWSTTNPRDRLRNSELGRAEEAAVAVAPVYVQGDNLRRFEQLRQGGAAACVADRQLVRYVVEVNGHAQALREHG